MTITLPARAFFIFALVSLFSTPISQAQIYKWVDANGRTHYSETQPSNAVSNLKSLRLDAAPVAVPNNSSATSMKISSNAMRVQAGATEAQIAASNAATNRPLLTNPPSTVETNATMCARARDLLPRIKAGTVKHQLWNGAITKVDDHDRITAENDIANFCR